MEYIPIFLIGIACIAFGIMNMKGNLSTLHRYHRDRVSEEDRLPFGKKVGLGTIIIGAAFIANGALELCAAITEKVVFHTVGTVIFIAGLVLGGGIAFWAMIKYNKDIF